MFVFKKHGPWCPLFLPHLRALDRFLQVADSHECCQDNGHKPFASLCSKYLYPFDLHPSLAKKKVHDLDIEACESPRNNSAHAESILGPPNAWRHREVGLFGSLSAIPPNSKGTTTPDPDEKKILIESIEQELRRACTV